MLKAKLALRKQGQESSVVEIAPGKTIGSDAIAIITGPCSVESYSQMETVAKFFKDTAVLGIRGGAYKPRTCPYDFQGMESEGLHILKTIGTEYSFPIVSEVLSPNHIDSMKDYVDVFQVGSRNMHNFDLLKCLGKTKKPILLKRGLSATIEEFVYAAEYILSEGNPNVILCERGIRSFDSFTRNILDLGAVVSLKQITHLPVMVDPSHAAGKRELILGLSKAAIAAGADGLLVECHPDPEKSVTDARQALSLQSMKDLVSGIEPVAKAVGRKI